VDPKRVLVILLVWGAVGLAPAPALAAWYDQFIPVKGAPWYDVFLRHKGVEPATDATYLEECGACHFAYQPGLLPVRSWDALMAPEALSDHFGDDAELEEPLRVELLNYLRDHAASRGAVFKRSRKVARSIHSSEAPLRITDTRYIRRKHADIPKSYISNEDVGSLSNCNNCHGEADQGHFDDDQVIIPHHGAWTGWRWWSWTRE